MRTKSRSLLKVRNYFESCFVSHHTLNLAYTQLWVAYSAIAIKHPDG